MFNCCHSSSCNIVSYDSHTSIDGVTKHSGTDSDHLNPVDCLTDHSEAIDSDDERSWYRYYAVAANDLHGVTDRLGDTNLSGTNHPSNYRCSNNDAGCDNELPFNSE